MDAWENTRKIEVLVTEHYGNRNPCVRMSTKISPREIGIELMKTMHTLTCYVVPRTGPFIKSDAIVIVNHLAMSMSEIMVNPKVCLKNNDIRPFSCIKDVDIHDKEALQKTLVYQRSLLSRLTIATFE